MKRRPKFEDFKLGCIFFVPFRDSEKGAFGYMKYDCETRDKTKSLDFPLADIYDRVCKLDEWSEDIKYEKIKIYDMILNVGNFYKTRHNTAPMILTDHHTTIIHPVKYGFFITGSKKYWYDSDAKNIVYPEDESQYRKVMVAFPPYDRNYIEAIFAGKKATYGRLIPD